MGILDTYRAMSSAMTRGLRYAQGRYGSRLFYTIGLYGDLISELGRQAFISRLPGHPEQAEDSLNQVGSDRGLFRFPSELRAAYAARVGNAWQSYAEAGSPIGLLREVNYWYASQYPFEFSFGGSNLPVLFENAWAHFRLFWSGGALPWAVATTYGSGHTYGETDLLYGLVAPVRDVDSLLRTIRKWKPSRSSGDNLIVVSGNVYGDPVLFYGGGFLYGNATTIVLAV